jgi:hypothetical protein
MTTGVIVTAPGLAVGLRQAHSDEAAGIGDKEHGGGRMRPGPASSS